MVELLKKVKYTVIFLVLKLILKKNSNFRKFIDGFSCVILLKVVGKQTREKVKDSFFMTFQLKVYKQSTYWYKSI